MFAVESNIKFQPIPGAWAEFTRGNEGDIGKYLKNRARTLTALAKASAPKKHGALAASIGWSYYAVPNPYVEVGSNLHYAYWVHEGTKPHVTMEPPGQAMRFTVRGRVVYAREVHHPGSRPQRYLSDHLRKVV
jgi:hypothetical protein